VLSETQVIFVQTFMTPPLSSNPDHFGDDLCSMIIESAKDFAIITEDKEPEIVKEESTLEINEENNSPLPPYSSIASSEEPKAENSELSKPDSNPYF
jgi:hypothetical protein